MRLKLKSIGKSRKLLFLFLLSFVLFYRSLFNFFTNDDFFLLKISRVGSVKEFVNFFNLIQGPDGLGMYRPLTTQVYYFLDWQLFNLNPFGLHIISFLVFFGLIYLVYHLAKIITKSEKISLTAGFLYASSATHFGHLYYPASFQELGLALFFLLSVIYFIRFLEKTDVKDCLLSFVFFVLALFSKETAVVLPFVLGLIYLFLRLQKRSKLNLGSIIFSLLPYFLLLSGYLYMRFAYYGFATGDSYIWDFSLRRAVNTLGWYGLWSLNLPEMLVDFVEPGLTFNPNLFKLHSRDIWPIFILFGAEVAVLIYSALKSKIPALKSKAYIYALSAFWFIGTLTPVLFLPIHKFTFYLTLPLFGVVLAISTLLIGLKSKMPYYLLLTFWLLASVMTLNLTLKTHWITRGGETAAKVYDYFNKNQTALKGLKNIVFFDEPQDNLLPWSPTNVLKTTLSDNNFFKVFFNEKYQVWYGKDAFPGTEAVYIGARQFLGY